MEKLGALARLGIKYLWRYRRRYGFLLAALVFGFAIVTFITSTKDGMYRSVYYSAQSHYAGDLVAIGYVTGTGQRYLGETEISTVLEAARSSGINPRHTVLRTTLSNISMLHFNGNAIRLKYVMGCDWEDEAHLFDKIKFAEALDSFPGDDGIILSVPTAQHLGAKMGDSVLLETDTRFGQINTSPFIVRGIVEDASIFGYYKAYVSRRSLNRLVLYEDGDCASIGFFFDDTGSAETRRVRLQERLAAKLQMGPLVYDRDELDREADEDLGWEGIKVFLLTMPVYLSEISDLLDVMNIITYFLYGMMLVIIFVSAAVTYRLILHERTKEMGVMRAIGFYGGDLRLVLWTEVLTLGFVSLLAGAALAWLLSRAVSLLSFSWFPSFEIFMEKGRLTALYLPGTMLVNVVSIFLLLLAASFVPSLRASRKNLCGLLSGEPL